MHSVKHSLPAAIYDSALKVERYQNPGGIRITINSEPYELHRWQTREYVDSWFADQSEQRTYQLPREKLVSLLPFQPGDIIRVLDIGTGDGALSLEVLGAYPKTQLVCHDFSETMLDRARQQLAQFLEAVAFVKGDLRDPAWTYAIEGKFDAVVSSIAIHNVAESNQGAPERIREIYGEVFGLVKPGGCFLNYDFVSAPGPVVHRIYRTRFGGPGARAILNQLEWLKQAGFDEVDCLWKDTRSAIFGGFRH